MLQFLHAWRRIKVSPVLHSARTLWVRQHLTVRMQNRAFCLEIMQEVWKAIPGYEGRYEVSDQGRVRSLDADVKCIGPIKGEYYSRRKGRMLKPGRMPFGHLSVALGKGNSRCVHELVLLAFVGAPYAGRECLHRNGVPNDNRLVNLHWGTRSENMCDAYAHGARDREKNRQALAKGRAIRWGHA